MSNVTSHHQRLAEAKRLDICERITSAIEHISLQMNSSGKQRVKVTQAEVLRMAGNVDKKTLKKPYHSDLLRMVKEFLDRANAGLQTPVVAPTSSSYEGDEPYSMAQLAQVLRATQLARDSALKSVAVLQMENEELYARISDLDARLHALGGGNVVPLGKQPVE